MSVNPEATGTPPERADDYLREANADDPRDDAQAPANEPGGPRRPADPAQPAHPDPL